MIVVTGGAGFIGSHIVDRLVARGHRVRVLDALLPAAHAARPDYLHPAAEYVEVDLRDPAALQALEGAEAVCHQASMVGLGVDFDDVVDYVGHNDGGTASLLWALHQLGGVPRLVLASSMVVYGEGCYRCQVHGSVRPAPRSVDDLERGHYEPACPRCGAVVVPEPVPETAPTDPRNVYAATKLHQEHLCAAFVREHPGTALTVLRYHNVYGPRMPHDTPYAGVASIFRTALAQGRAPRVFEDGGQLRDFVHVTDVADANVLALTAAGSRPGTYNVASGRPRSVLDMATALADAAGPAAPRPVVVGGYRLGDVRHVFASPDRAVEGLGFQASVPFEEGMAEFAFTNQRGAP